MKDSETVQHRLQECNGMNLSELSLEKIKEILEDIGFDLDDMAQPEVPGRHLLLQQLSALETRKIAKLSLDNQDWIFRLKH